MPAWELVGPYARSGSRDDSISSIEASAFLSLVRENSFWSSPTLSSVSWIAVFADVMPLLAAVSVFGIAEDMMVCGVND